MNQPHGDGWLDKHHEVRWLEAKVLELVAEGKGDEEIAAALEIKPRAVKERITGFCDREQFERAHGGRRLPAWGNRHRECCIPSQNHRGTLVSVIEDSYIHHWWLSNVRAAPVGAKRREHGDESQDVRHGCWRKHRGRGRRMYASVARCTSEAWLAFYYGYNGGLDQFGRTVLNPGEVDLSYAFASSLGLAYLQNDFVSVVPLWHGC